MVTELVFLLVGLFVCLFDLSPLQRRFMFMQNPAIDALAFDFCVGTGAKSIEIGLMASFSNKSQMTIFGNFVI